MSAIANIVCLLLIATPLAIGENSFPDEVNKTVAAIESHYKIAKAYVDGLVSQISLDAPLQAGSSFDKDKPAAGCFNFLNSEIGGSRAQTIKCSADSLKVATAERDRLTRAFEKSVAAVRAYTCPLTDLEATYTRRNSWCTEASFADLANLAAKAGTDFFDIAANVRRVYYKWVSEAGRCVANSEEHGYESAWIRTCQNGQ